MIAVISPAKTLDFESPVKNKLHTMPEFLQEAEIINSVLRKMSVPELMRQMSLSASQCRTKSGLVCALYARQC